ncbi:MAG: Ig-like domain-containing protein [Leptospira sp.]|nr:Ig-like domain-containing protein [Leptospira sp.]
MNLRYFSSIFLTFLCAYQISCTPKPEPFVLGVLALPAATEVTAFEVSSTSPTNNETNVNRNTNISITFSKNLDNSSISGNISFSQPTANTITSLTATTNNRVLTLRPSTIFDANSSYSITLRSAIKSTTTETLGTDYIFRFTTQ